jgi:hypothetical protein
MKLAVHCSTSHAAECAAEPGPALAAGRLRRLRSVALGALFFLLGTFFVPGPALGLDIQQTHWGFDGQVVANRFNLLSLLVSNPSSEPFDGRLELRKSVAKQPVDAPLVESVYLAPYSSRWVQFHPYAKLDWEEWTVSWGPASAGSFSLAKPRQGKPACILLEEVDALGVGGGALRRFPENLFPAQLTAMDGLASIVLDHIPRWEEGRQRAFLDWVRQGGHVHLLKNQRGEFPRFSGVLQSLNVTVPRSRVGFGLVQRHERDRRQVDVAYVEQILATGRDPSEAAAAAPVLNPPAQSSEDQPLFNYQWEGDDSLFTALKKMSRPAHSWILIHLLSLAYLALIFPGCYVIAQQRGGDYRIVFGALLGIVAVFSLAFLIVGRRGYGERTALHSVAIARLTADGRYDVSQWSNAFAVDGGDYTFSHHGSGRIYSSCQDEEAVHGEIVAGAEARFTADMPPFSSRAFGHRTLLDRQTMAGMAETDSGLADAKPALADVARAPVDVTAWETTLGMRQDPALLRDPAAAKLVIQPERILQKLTLVKRPDFPSEYQQVYALYGRHVYSLIENGDQFELKSDAGSMAMFLQISQQNQFGGYYDPWSEMELNSSDLFGAMFLPLVARACNISRQREALNFALPDDRARVLVYAPMPKAFYLQNERFGAQRGYVLFCFDVFPPEQR